MSCRPGASSSSFSISSLLSDEINYSDILSSRGNSSTEHSCSRSELLLALSNAKNTSPAGHIQDLAPYHERAEMDFDADLHDRLQKVLDEIMKLKKENYEESCQRQQVHKVLLMVHKKAKKLMDYLLKEQKNLKETKEARATDQCFIQTLKKKIEWLNIRRDVYLEKSREESEHMLHQPLEEPNDAHEKHKQEMEILRKEIKQLKIQKGEYLAKCQEANEQKLALVKCDPDTDRAVNALENDLGAYKRVLDLILLLMCGRSSIRSL